VANYSLLIKPSAAKELEDLPRRDRLRAIARIRGLSAEPRPAGAEKLSGQEKYRVRQGNYRILYSIDDGEASVTVVRIAHRSHVYR
jgi:mRNA interferase RelE/StbE